MPDGDGYDVHTEAMREHAGRLDGVQDDIGTALDAAAEVSLGGTEAYGILCSPILTPLIGSIEILGGAAIGATHLAVGATALGVRGMAETYDFMEQAAEDLFNSIAGE